MTETEARQRAIELGALEPQGFMENMRANWIENNRGQRWADTELAQQRLKLWTQAILDGKNPKHAVG